jgi:hypothetical protein
MLILVAWLWWWTDTEGPRIKNARNQVSLSLGLTSSPALQWRLAFNPPAEVSQAPNAPDPEQSVRQIYAQLGEGERAQALATASMLVERFPNFQLGQLLYADLLNISSANPVVWPAADDNNAPSLRKRLDGLLLEA